MPDHDIDVSLTDTLKKSDLSNVAGNIAEVGLDKIIEDGLFQDIPVVSSIIGLVKTGGNIQNYYFSKKLLKFLVSISEITLAERLSMVERLEQDDAYSQNVGESIILLLDRMDDISKPKLVARAFKAFSTGAIDSTQLQRINYAIDKLLMVDIEKLVEFSRIHTSDRYDLIVGQNFLNAGLAYVGTGYGAGGVHPNDICQLFITHILES